jgi:hypothetical protein
MHGESQAARSLRSLPTAPTFGRSSSSISRRGRLDCPGTLWPSNTCKQDVLGSSAARASPMAKWLTLTRRSHWHQEPASNPLQPPCTYRDGEVLTALSTATAQQPTSSRRSH